MRAPGERGRVAPLALWAASALVLACASVKGGPGHAGASGSSGAGTTGAAGTAGLTSGAAGAAGVFGLAGTGGGPPGCQGPCTDFPTTPLKDVGIPDDAPMRFGSAPTGAGPCITEPEDGSLFPNNWLRPRVKFTPVAPGTLHEIRFHTDREANDLVAFTTSDSWAMPRDIWLGLAANVRDTPITVTVRAEGGGASSASFTIAPVPAPGSIVFWAANPDDYGAKQTTSSLQGFAPGDEGTVTTLAVGNVQMQTRGANGGLRPVTCIGCHNSTPDGESVGFIDNFPWSMAIAGVKPGREGLLPLKTTTDGYLTIGGMDTIRQPGMGIFSFSKSHWTTGDRIAVSPYYLGMPCGLYDQSKPDVRLAWLDLEAPPVEGGCPTEGKHFGIIARNGDTRGAANPTWSHDGKTIVYSSTEAGQDGRLEKSTTGTDLFTVPYNNRAGGDAVPLPGAAEAAADEYYPAFSPDDALVVFDSVPTGQTMYANPNAELYVVPAASPSQPGGSSPTTATRLVANDPPKCSPLMSPGINNHWAKWAPEPEIAPGSGKKFYWLIFSSNRYGLAPKTANGRTVQVSQLYATAIVVDETSMQTFPAIYLWNQDKATLNTTPAWDPFKIPVVP